MEEEDEMFDLGTLNEYEMESNEDGSVLIQSNCVAIKHTKSGVTKLLPLTEEVLQALGLALVTDEEHAAGADQKVKTELLDLAESPELLQVDQVKLEMQLEEAEEHLEEPEEHLEEPEEHLEELEEHLQEPAAVEDYAVAGAEESTMAAADDSTVAAPVDKNNEKGSITIVFTDDEEAEIDKLAGDGKSLDSPDLLVWSREMTHQLLDLYERHQRDFAFGTQRHRKLWKNIHQTMSESHPELLRWSESHLQSKFGGLKRTYRGALEYLQNNLHTTRWPYFERMHKIMQSKYDLDGKKGTSLDTSGSTIEAKWLQSWTPLLLDAHTALCPRGAAPRANHWMRVCGRMTRADARCERLTPARARREFVELQARYAMPEEREALGADVVEKLAQLNALAGAPSGDTMPAGTPPVPVSVPAAVAHPTGEPATWPPACVSALLGAMVRAPAAPPSRLARTARAALAAAGEDSPWLTPAAVGKQINKLRKKYHSLLDADPESIKWPFFRKAAKAFAAVEAAGAGGAGGAGAVVAAGGAWAAGAEGWGRGPTLQLLRLYEHVSQELDDSGPKFWLELAKRFNESQPTIQTTHQICEKKMQSLCHRYQTLLRNDPERSGDAKQWHLYEPMHRLFGDKEAETWPTRAVQALLAAFERALPRLGAGRQQRVWRDVAAGLQAEGWRPTPEECRAKLVQLKHKYCKLMRDDEAARAWPLYKRMSELFSSHLWSKSNVNLLLDIYEELKDSLQGAGAPAAAGWREVSARFNARSVSSCVSAAQCRAEMHALRARHRAAHPATPWPFRQRMNDLFGSEVASVPVKVEATSSGIINGDKNDGPPEEYTWTEDSVYHLLDLYQQHRHQFGLQPRQAVWRRIDACLARQDPAYCPDKKGAGGWYKYMDIMTKYMDIKGNRCAAGDWPFYERMEAMFGKQRVDEGASDASDRSASPSAELEAILCAPQGSRKRPIGDTNFSGVLINSPRPKDTPAKRKKDEPTHASLTEETNLRLLELYSNHRLLLRTASASATLDRSKATAWRRIARQMHEADPAFQRTGDQCRALVAEIEDIYRRTKVNNKLVPIPRRLSVAVYQKIEAIIEQQKEDNVQTDLTNGANSAVLQSLLKEIKRKNDISEKRHKLLQKQGEEKRLQHAESMDMMKNILKALSNPMAEVDGSDVLNMLEKTMEEIHK